MMKQKATAEIGITMNTIVPLPIPGGEVESRLVFDQSWGKVLSQRRRRDLTMTIH